MEHNLFSEKNSYCHYTPTPSKSADGTKHMDRLYELSCNPGAFKILQAEDRYCSKCGRRIFHVNKK